MFDVIYAHDERLKYWTKVMLIMGFPPTAMMLYIDVYRQLFIGLQVFFNTFVLELCIVIGSTIIMYLFCFHYELEFYGLGVG